MKKEKGFVGFLNRNIKPIYITTAIIVLVLSIIQAVQLQETQHPFLIVAVPIAFMVFFAMAGTLSSMVGGVIGLIVIYCC